MLVDGMILGLCWALVDSHQAHTFQVQKGNNMASDFKDAFLKAGIVTKEKIEAQEKQIEIDKKRKIEDEENAKQRKAAQEHNEYLSKIERFESRWQSSNSKNFIKHLLNAFLPFDKGQIVFDWAMICDRPKKCCICNCKLISKVDALEKVPEITETFSNVLKNAIKEEGFISGLSSTTKQVKQQIFGDKLFGIFSQDSTKLFCGECYSIFTEWVQNKMFTDMSFARYITSIRSRQNVINSSN